MLSDRKHSHWDKHYLTYARYIQFPQIQSWFHKPSMPPPWPKSLMNWNQFQNGCHWLSVATLNLRHKVRNINHLLNGNSYSCMNIQAWNTGYDGKLQRSARKTIKSIPTQRSEQYLTNFDTHTASILVYSLSAVCSSVEQILILLFLMWRKKFIAGFSDM